MEAGQQQRGGFVANVNIAFVSQIFIFGLAFLFRIALARGLGDEGLGTYSLFYLTVLIAGAVGSMGVGLGNLYFLNKGDYGLRELLNNSLFVVGATGVVATIIILIYGLASDAEAFVSGRAYWLYAPTVPVVAAYLISTSFLQGRSRFVALAVVALAQGLSALGIAAGLFLADALNVYGAILAWTGSFALASVVALLLIGIKNFEIVSVLRPNWGVLWEQVRYGSKGQLANLAQLFNYRLDQFLVAAFLTRASVGHYTVAVGVSESAWWISGAVAMVLTPSLTRMGRERAEQVTPVVCRNTLLISVLGAIGLVAASPLIIRILFGSAFEPAVQPLILLMPGVAAISVARVLGSYLFSQGKVIYTTYTMIIALVMTLILDLALIPLLGVPGAAIASSIAYTTSLVATLYWYKRFSGGSLWDVLVPRGSDWQLYLNVWRRLRAVITS